MEIIDFGKISEAIKSMNLAYLGRDIGPVVSFGENKVDNYIGSFAEASNAQQLSGLQTQEFLWAVHRWDDGENKVV